MQILTIGFLGRKPLSKQKLKETKIMEVNQLKRMIARGENNRHQFKEDIRNGDSLAVWKNTLVNTIN